MVGSQTDLAGNPVAITRGGYAPDRATGKPVDMRKPEETVRQEYEKILNEDYGYDYAQMDIEVFIQRGSKQKPKNDKDRADIVVYKTADKSKRDQNTDILGIIETKRPQKEDGLRQLMSYMSATSCSWGVWTNGSEIEYVYKDLKTGEIKTDFVFQIPSKGQRWEDIGVISKDKLMPTNNLKPIFRRILNTLYANTNISRREKLGNEMIKLLFCKIWDERYYLNRSPKFQIGYNESPEEVAKNIKELFQEVKNELSEDGVFDMHEEIKLEDRSIAYVVGELERYSLLKTDKDVVGDAFEVFADTKLVGERGEFFTPREVVKTAVQIVNPQPGQKILDPACGSGGFLIYSLENVWKEMEVDRKYKGLPNLDKLKKEVAEKHFFGIDKEPDLVKIAKAYMAIVGDGRGGIVMQNTLHKPEDYEPIPKAMFVQNNNEFKKFDIILTNPPFGTKIKVIKDDSASFHLGHIWKYDKTTGTWTETNTAKETEPQVLFVERCLEMLRDGGTLAIVLPETNFHAPKARYVLEYIKNNNNIIAIVDLAHNTFRPHNNAKTLLLVLQKNRPQNKKIIMAVAEEIGHDANGRDLFRYDYSKQAFTTEIWDDTKIIRKELAAPNDPNNTSVFEVDISDIKNNVYVPRYYWKRRTEALKEAAKKQGMEFVRVSELIDKGIIKHYDGHGSPPSEFKGKGEIPYIRVADIMNWEIYKNPTALIPKSVYLAKKGKSGIDLQTNDILFVRRGSYRIGSVALVSPYDREVLLARELSIFRVVKEDNEYGINPYYLIYLFSHQLTQQQLYNLVFIDTTLPNLGNRWAELYLPIAKNPKEREYITERIKHVFDKKEEANKEINKLKMELGNFIT